MAQQARNTNATMMVAVIAIAALVIILAVFFGTRQSATTTTVEDALRQSATIVLYENRMDPPVIEAVSGRPVQLYVNAVEGTHTIEIQPLVQPQQVPQGQAITINLTAPTAGEYPIIVEGPSGRVEGKLVVLEEIGQAPPPREPAGGPGAQ